MHGSVRPHTTRQTKALLRQKFHWNVFEYPPYCPDLAPSDFFMFPEMKENLAGKHFANDEDLKDAGCITRRPYGIKWVYTNWCQGSTSALMSKATMWKSIKQYLGMAKRSLLY